MNNIEIFILLILSISIFYTAITYSKEGDINTLTGNLKSPWKLSKIYNTQEKIIKRLHSLIIYKHNYVKWNKLILLSISLSIFIVHYYNKKFVFSEIILFSTLIFLVLELPYRWCNTHRLRALDAESSILCGLIKKIETDKK